MLWAFDECSIPLQCRSGVYWMNLIYLPRERNKLCYTRQLCWLISPIQIFKNHIAHNLFDLLHSESSAVPYPTGVRSLWHYWYHGTKRCVRAPGKALANVLQFYFPTKEDNWKVSRKICTLENVDTGMSRTLGNPIPFLAHKDTLPARKWRVQMFFKREHTSGKERNSAISRFLATPPILEFWPPPISIRFLQEGGGGQNSRF